MKAPSATAVKMKGLPDGQRLWSYELRYAESGRLYHASAGSSGYYRTRDEALSSAAHFASFRGRPVWVVLGDA